LRLAILSDIHDQQGHLNAILAQVRAASPDAVILCGDLTTPAVLAACRLPGLPLSFCLGNCDQARADALRHAALAVGASGFGELGRFSLPNGAAVAFSHFPAVARRAALSGLYQAVFYGHTHKASEERLLIDGKPVLLANPGDVEGRYGRVSALLWDSDSGACTWLDALP
jgi:putative phosphoesterase